MIFSGCLTPTLNAEACHTGKVVKYNYNAAMRDRNYARARQLILSKKIRKAQILMIGYQPPWRKLSSGFSLIVLDLDPPILAE